MPILIDGHNLIAALPDIDLADKNDEQKLVVKLRRYVSRKPGRRVVVVFDGGVYGHPVNLNGYGVECHFAYAPDDADHELIRRIRKITRKGEWLVVSSDRQVTGAARAHGVKAVSSQQFAQQLAAAQQAQVTPVSHDKHRDRPLSRREVDEWLRLFGIEDDGDDDPQT